MQKYAERWISIRRRVSHILNLPNDHPIPDDYELSKFEDMFCDASLVFDKILYKPGKRLTWKDKGASSRDKMGRHNFPNFNFAVHQIFALLGIRKKLNVHFYWRLPKTRKVLDDLLERWKLICQQLRWPYCSREVLIDESYALDPPAFFVARDPAYTSMGGISLFH